MMAPRGTLGKFSVDDKVEVLSSEEGFSDAWALATVIGIAKGRVLVEYSKFVDEAGGAIREKVLLHRLRHVPLFPANFNVNIGLRVEGHLQDCWWPGEVAEQHPRKGTRIQFDDGDAAWLGRAKVRPMLRRAPRSADDGDADAEGEKAAFGVRAPPPLRVPLRLPHGVNPNDAIAAVGTILSGAGWQALQLSDVQARLEASLLPDEPAGWMGPWRHTLLGAIERVLLSRLRPDSQARRGRRNPAGGKGAKRARGNGVGAKKVDTCLSRALMHSGADAIVPSAAAHLRAYTVLLSSADAASYVLSCIGPQLMQLLHHEQVTLYKYAPREQRLSSSSSPPLSPLEDDDTVSCLVSRAAPGVRHACSLCATCIFNVHLLAHCPGRYELCVDCWGAAMRGEAEWPAPPPRRAVLAPSDFRAACTTPPELLAELSGRLQAMLPEASLAQPAAPRGQPAAPRGQPAAPRGQPPAASAGSARPEKGERGGTCSSSRQTVALAESRLIRMPGEPTGPEGVPCPEMGPGWRRVSKKRTSDPTGRHTDHTFVSPDGQRFNSRVKAVRYAGADSGVESGDDESEADTWAQCERCDKWRKLSGGGEALPEHWFCEHNPNPAFASC